MYIVIIFTKIQPSSSTKYPNQPTDKQHKHNIVNLWMIKAVNCLEFRASTFILFNYKGNL